MLTLAGECPPGCSLGGVEFTPLQVLTPSEFPASCEVADKITRAHRTEPDNASESMCFLGAGCSAATFADTNVRGERELTLRPGEHRLDWCGDAPLE